MSNPKFISKFLRLYLFPFIYNTFLFCFRTFVIGVSPWRRQKQFDIHILKAKFCTLIYTDSVRQELEM
jgi:hypothetical protein